MKLKTVVTGLLIFFIFCSALQISGAAQQEETLPFWDQNWSYRQELEIPINTGISTAIGQPIDLRVSFTHPCWAKNIEEHSIRVSCWDGATWHEVDSQMYDPQSTGTDIIETCSIVFIIPSYANGNERYFVYYDDTEKPAPRYTDHVSVEDSYYFSSPIADITAEATYYGIKEDGFYVYGVGQSGTFLDQHLAQVVVKQKPGSKTFDILNADQIASFAFSYSSGKKDTDEVSSDNTLVSKKIFIDGNLMVEFGIISESSNGVIRTTAIYKYYYTPEENKRICVHVTHVTFDNLVVRGEENLDGRYGALISFKSRNLAIEKLNFGNILPVLDFYGKDNKIDEYMMNTNPESKNREWIISFADDADLGEEAWLAYGEGQQGKSQGLLFSSNTDIVKSGVDERDGIQLKVAEREYFNFLGTEVDYASINFGRNAYEKGYSHDLTIPSNFIVDFDTELFSSNTGGYLAIQTEAVLYKELVKHRSVSQDSAFQEKQKKYNVTVVTHAGGTRFTFPWLANKTGLPLPVMWVELFRDETLVAAGVTTRSFFTRSFITFHNITAGTYLVKIFRKILNSSKVFIGADVLNVPAKTKTHVFCTWQRTIKFTFTNQDGQGIPGITVVLRNSEKVVFVRNTTDSTGLAVLSVPYNPREPYQAEAYYRDYVVYKEKLPNSLKNLKVPVTIALYDLTVEVRDSLGLPPGVAIHPSLSSTVFPEAAQILSVETNPGVFIFEDIPAGEYTLQISYADIVDEHSVTLPEDGTLLHLTFSAVYNIQMSLFDTQGNPLINTQFLVTFSRDNKEVYECRENDLTCTLPPAQYSIHVYKGDTTIGQTDIMLTNNREVQIVTTMQSMLPSLLTGIALVVLGALLILVFLKKVSLAGFLKGCAVALLLLAVIQPWWALSGSNSQQTIEKTTQMYLQPPVMIESTTSGGKTILSLATMPDIFIDFLGKIPILIYIGCVLIGVGVVLKRLRKKKSVILLSIGCLFLLLATLGIYYSGASKLCEISVGPIQGEGVLTFTINEASVNLESQWGLITGFFLVLGAFFVLLLANLWECKHLISRLFLRKRDGKQSKP